MGHLVIEDTFIIEFVFWFVLPFPFTAVGLLMVNSMSFFSISSINIIKFTPKTIWLQTCSIFCMAFCRLNWNKHCFFLFATEGQRASKQQTHCRMTLYFILPCGSFKHITGVGWNWFSEEMFLQSTVMLRRITMAYRVEPDAPLTCSECIKVGCQDVPSVTFCVFQLWEISRVS